MKSSKPVIVGAAGHALTAAEARLFERERPLGLILFARNIQSPDQVRALAAEFRQAVELPYAPVMIDQEGGRVARLAPPHWPALPPAALFGRMAGADFVEAAAALALAISIISTELRRLGISINTIPVLDLPQPDADGVIGDRAFGDDPTLAARLGRVVVDTSMAHGVLPVIKHLPGHGRAQVDSHLALPRVAADRQTLRDHDFVPFKALADAPFAMTAHIVYEAFDSDRPASISKTVIDEAIRGDIGFEGVLISDDIMMKALTGSVAERAVMAREAGSDIVLHCSGVHDEMEELLSALAPMSREEEQKCASALARISSAESIDMEQATRRLQQLVAPFTRAPSA